MADRNQEETPSEIDLLRIIKAHGRLSTTVACGCALVVAVIGAIYGLWLQPVREASVLEFRPTFAGSESGRYPNGLAFSKSDVAAGSVVDLVYDANKIQEYCSREAFRGAFFVEQHSDQSSFLDAEYRIRLADRNLTAVDRERLQVEYEAKRAALPIQFRLVFVKPAECSDLPQVAVNKAMTEVLSTWANESEARRGVLNLQVEVLTPSVMDINLSQDGSRLLKADLIRTGLWRVVANIDTVRDLPGAELVRLGENKMTFVEMRNKVVDLVRSRLEPLVVNAGQSLARQSLLWVTETVAAAEREQRAAEGRAQAYHMALREYSGVSPTAPNRPNAATTSQGSDVQTLAPQVDRSFVDRIVELSEANTSFRRTLTESMVRATVEAVEAENRADYYRRLLQSLRSPVSSALAPDEVDVLLTDIVDQAKKVIADFNSLYDEFSRVSLRATAALYQTDKPVTTEVSRSFTAGQLLMLVLGTFVAALLGAFGFFVAQDRLNRVSVD